MARVTYWMPVFRKLDGYRFPRTKIDHTLAYPC